MKSQYFSIGKESYESIIIISKLTLSVIPIFLLIRFFNPITNFITPLTK